MEEKFDGGVMRSTKVQCIGPNTIVEEKNGLGKLKSGAGWISLGSKYVQKVK